jgi:septal ring factor EnvC (AmiA/AmiB activator)
MKFRWEVAKTQRDVAEQERQLKVITDDQDRLRKNLREMPKDAAAYQRYLKKFDDQETEIEKLQKQLKEMQDEEHARRKDYEAFLANLSVE